VIVDRDLAALYGVETRRLNEQVRRNRDRFPDDFAFQLTREETEAWRRSRSQNAILKRGLNIKYPPLAFTEHGAIMAANVFNSPRAVQISVFVVRAFVRMRSLLADTRELVRHLAAIAATQEDRLSGTRALGCI
jgi:phage regulator Rha-like protein